MLFKRGLSFSFFICSALCRLGYIYCVYGHLFTLACSGVTSPMIGGGVTTAPQTTPVCLQADVLVPMVDGSVKRAGELMVGDEVRGENGRADPIVLIRGVDKVKVSNDIRFRTQTGLGTTMSHRHGVFVTDCTGGKGKSWRMKPAMDLEVGECVPTADGGVDEVIHIEKVLVNARLQPITQSGVITADGIVVSCYTLAKQNETQHTQHAYFQSARRLYNWAEKIYIVFSDEQYALRTLEGLIKGLGLERYYADQ